MNTMPDPFDELIPAPDTQHAAALRDGLARRADAEGLLEVTYRTLDTPIGELLVAATTRGVVRVAFEREDFDIVLDDLAAAEGTRVLRSGLRTEDAARQLEEYFEQRRRVFDVALDLGAVSGFRGEVLEQLRQLGYGEQASYSRIATALGRPGATRAVGTACARNPVPIIVPCHRVVRSDGSIGQYLGGTEAKESLLRLEATPR